MRLLYVFAVILCCVCRAVPLDSKAPFTVLAERAQDLESTVLAGIPVQARTTDRYRELIVELGLARRTAQYIEVLFGMARRAAKKDPHLSSIPDRGKVEAELKNMESALGAIERSLVRSGLYPDLTSANQTTKEVHLAVEEVRRLLSNNAYTNPPNQALEPTTTAVTHPAGAGCAPAVVVAHLGRSAKTGPLTATLI